MKKIGIIYKITNKINGKLYIGQTSYNELKKEKGASQRLKQHIYCAKTHANKCRILESAIRKYGSSNFVTETIAYCDLNKKINNEMDILDDLEIKYIYIFDSTNREYGYNITLGGGGTRGHMTEKKRENISRDQGPKIKINGIVLKYRDDKLVGYRAQRKQNGRKYEKLFSDQSKTLKENLRLAKLYLEDVKNGDLSKYNSFNRKEKMPQNIYKETDEKGQFIGYRFQIIKNKKKYSRVYTSKTLTLKKKYEIIMREKKRWENMEKKYNNKQVSEKEYEDYLKTLELKPKVHDLPSNIKREYAGGKIVGYRFQMVIDKKRYTKVFKHSGQSMEEKLQKAINAKEDFLKQISKN